MVASGVSLVARGKIQQQAPAHTHHFPPPPRNEILPEDTATIGTRLGWQTRLHNLGFTLRGHHLVTQQSLIKKPNP